MGRVIHKRLTQTINVPIPLAGVGGHVTTTLGSFIADTYYGRWDYYKVNCMVVHFMPQWAKGDPLKKHTTTQCGSIIDYDDNADVTSYNNIRNHSTFRPFWSDKPHSRKFTPRSTEYAVSSSSTALPDVIAYKKWMNTAASNVAFHGLKYWLGGSTDTATPRPAYILTIKWYVSFGGAKNQWPAV